MDGRIGDPLTEPCYHPCGDQQPENEVVKSNKKTTQESTTTTLADTSNLKNEIADSKQEEQKPSKISAEALLLRLSVRNI